MADTYSCPPGLERCVLLLCQALVTEWCLVAPVDGVWMQPQSAGLFTRGYFARALVRNSWASHALPVTLLILTGH